MEASKQMRAPAGDRKTTRAPRRLIRQAMVRCNATGKSRVVSVSRLDALRWHIRLTPRDAACGKEIYLSPEDGGLLYVTTANANMHITLHGEMGEDCLRNLGDCFVNALCDTVRRIDIWFGDAKRVPTEAWSVFESLGRNIARQEKDMDITLHGLERITSQLDEAFAQGTTRAGLCGIFI